MRGRPAGVGAGLACPHPALGGFERGHLFPNVRSRPTPSLSRRQVTITALGGRKGCGLDETQ